MAPSRCPAPSPHPVAAATARRRGPGAAAAALARRVSSMRLRRRGPRALLPRRSPSSSPRGDLPRPRSSSNSGVAGGAGSSAASVAAGSQPMSQQSFSQGVVGSGGASSLLHSQSQLSQASLDENLLSLHLASPTRDQRFGLHDDSSKKMPSLPVSSASCVREESQLQLAKTSSNLVHRWNPSLPDGRCSALAGVVPTEDVERKFQHMASSVHKVGMVLDSVQNDVVQEIVGAVRSLNSKIDAIQMPTDQRCTTNGRPLMNLLPVDRNERPQVNQTPEVPRVSQTPVTNMVNQTPVASLVNQTPAENEKTLMSQTPATNGRHLVSQTPAANGKTLMSQTSAANGRSLASQVPVANGKPLINQIPAPKGRPMVRQKTTESGRPQMNQIPVASGWIHTNKIPAPEVHPATLVCPAKQAAADPKAMVDDGKLKVLPRKLTGSKSRVTPKLEEAATTKLSRAAATEKVVIFIEDSDDDSDVRASCVIRSSGSGERECDLMKVGTEESEEIMRRARKRRRREMQAIVVSMTTE